MPDCRDGACRLQKETNRAVTDFGSNRESDPDCGACSQSDADHDADTVSYRNRAETNGNAASDHRIDYADTEHNYGLECYAVTDEAAEGNADAYEISDTNLGADADKKTADAYEPFGSHEGTAGESGGYQGAGGNNDSGTDGNAYSYACPDKGT